ncbi:hypothetical protein [Ponticaulis profundi]|uniref:Permease n=1 Tax=Ponticaulis profundi TaxID=2665222 RepID=A0ABW1S7A1_9PROT
MFVGHYSAALAGKVLKPGIPLWHLFLAVQFVDFVWAFLIMSGVERVRFTPGFMDASMLDLYYMPFTHSLVANVIWAALAGVLYGWVWQGKRKWLAGLVMSSAVFSHWLLDLVAHGPDLAILFGEPKLGLGLWHSLFWTQLVELGAMLAGAGLYIWIVKPRGLWPVLAFAILIMAMVAMQFINHQPVDTPPSVTEFALTALFAYTFLTCLAWLTDLAMARQKTMADETD